MEPINFCYWLQGYFEISEQNKYEGLNHRQVNMVRDHLNLVFGKHKLNDLSTLILPMFNGSC